ncbi:MAG: hypothetical protein HQL84_07495 [Magnetococcales bacterium]|nr:hypothetical protein [Magnetococcales bacterium]MBF0149875.1 hypothetical protein [Magnetococcales bacterium]MBF0631849.1 hypothetical protein [Magnetococcales bacterium]
MNIAVDDTGIDIDTEIIVIDCPVTGAGHEVLVGKDVWQPLQLIVEGC